MIDSVHPLPSLSAGGGGRGRLSLQPNFPKGGRKFGKFELENFTKEFSYP